MKVREKWGREEGECGEYVNLENEVFDLLDGNLIYESGYFWAHEILHVLTIRGSRLMDMPIRKPSLEYYFPGGHFDWTKNLIMDGLLVGNIPRKNPNVLHDSERILPQADYFMFKFIFSNVGY